MFRRVELPPSLKLWRDMMAGHGIGMESIGGMILLRQGFGGRIERHVTNTEKDEFVLGLVVLGHSRGVGEGVRS